MNTVLDIGNLSKSYAGVRGSPLALRGVSLTIGAGEVVGLLGLNGAGKSTLLRCALGLIRPTSGSVTLFGSGPSSTAWRSRVGYLPEAFDAPAGMNSEQVLALLGRLGGLRHDALRQRIAEISTTVELPGPRKKVGAYSKGMKVRLGLAQALLNSPLLLVLDEPTDGLDPRGIRTVRGLITRLREEGVSTMISSHLISEIELVADRIVILHEGVIVREGKTRQILPREGKHQIEIASQPPPALGVPVIPHGSHWLVEVQDSGALEKVLSVLNASGAEIVAMNSVRPTLETVFFDSITRMDHGASLPH